jgi:glycosyltransferase involved in cell wall biosynthesis
MPGLVMQLKGERENPISRLLSKCSRFSFFTGKMLKTSSDQNINRYTSGMGKIPNPRGSKITVIIPTLNEERNIGDVIRELQYLGLYNILIVDGNSTDHTVEIAKDLGAKVLYQDGKGKGDALRKAFNHDELADWVVMIDADGSMDPGEISNFVEQLRSGVDVVKASRFMPSGFSEDITFTRRLGNAFFVLLVNALWGANYTDLCYGFAAFRKEALRKMHPYLGSKSFEIETELFIKAKKLGLRIKEVPSVELRRKNGKSNLSTFKDGFLILKTILMEVLYS